MKYIKNFVNKSTKGQQQSLIGLMTARFILKGYEFYINALAAIIYKNDLKKLIELKDSCKTKSVLLCATGCSIGEVDWQYVRTLQETGALDVFAINNFSYGKTVNIVPNYYCLTAPAYFGEEELPETKLRRDEYNSVVEFINENKIPTFIPVTRYRKCHIKNAIPFINQTNLYSDNISDPSRTLGYRSYTSLYAITLCQHLGYEKILLAGYDNDTFLTFSLENNEKYIDENHCYDIGKSRIHLKKDYFPTTSSVFYSYYEQFFYLEKFSAKNNVEVAAGGRYLDVFNRTDHLLLKRDSITSEIS